MKKIVKHRVFWPAVALVALILLNAIARPQFLRITVQDGQLYGSLIELLRNSAPLMLVSLGMMIVIATRGIDLSVGAMMAVSGAVALTIIADSPTPEAPGTLFLAIGAGVIVTLDLRSVERFSRRGAQDPADHRDARAHARRPRHRPAHHERLHHDRHERALQVHVAGLLRRASPSPSTCRSSPSPSSTSSSAARHSECSPRPSASTRRPAALPACARAASSGAPTRRADCSRASPASCTAPTSWRPTRMRRAASLSWMRFSPSSSAARVSEAASSRSRAPSSACSPSRPSRRP